MKAWQAFFLITAIFGVLVYAVVWLLIHLLITWN